MKFTKNLNQSTGAVDNRNNCPSEIKPSGDYFELMNICSIFSPSAGGQFLNPEKMNLEQLWIEACVKKPRSIVFPESRDPRTLQAIAKMANDRVAGSITLIGSPDDTKRSLADDIKTWRTIESAVHWTDDKDTDLQSLTEQVLLDQAIARGKAPKSKDDTKKLTAQKSDPLYQAGALVAAKQVDTALAGAVSTTAAVIRAALSTVGLAQGIHCVSGSFIMERAAPDLSASALLFADAGVIIEPTVEQLVDIAAASVETWTKLVPMSGFHQSGDQAVVAFLSFSTKGSANHPAAKKMAEAADAFKRKYPAIKTDGELQFDAAIVPEISARKCPESPVAGNANIFIFPDLGAGNIAYKITQRLAGYHAYGPILQGLAQPYSDLSRGSTPHDIYMSALLNLLRV